MSFSDQLQNDLSDRRLLAHPFYQQWTEGALGHEDLRRYAGQYFHHVDAFPRYVSATHSRCPDIEARQVLLENLNEEEAGSLHHPELWLRFAEGLGRRREDVRGSRPLPETAGLVQAFFAQAYASYESGLGALYAYEYQVPEVAEQKIRSLQRFYGVRDERALSFFRVHVEADVAHSCAVAELLDGLGPDQRERATVGARAAATALWRFLDGVAACPSDVGQGDSGKHASATQASRSS